MTSNNTANKTTDNVRNTPANLTLLKKNKPMPAVASLSLLEQVIINQFQRNFPLSPRPYQVIAEAIRASEEQVLAAIEHLNDQDVLSRVGAVFDHKKAGSSTLAALAVPPEKLDDIAAIVNKFEQVNHNYARQSHSNKHDFNLWFVVTAYDDLALQEVLKQIEILTKLPILKLPMEQDYHIDLGFKINFGTSHPNETASKAFHVQHSLPSEPSEIIKSHKLNEKNNVSDALTMSSESPLSSDQQQALRQLLEHSLPITLKPYQDIAQAISASESQIIEQILHWQKTGLIRRFGLVIKHRKLGFNANAMVVWNINDQYVDDIAKQLAEIDEVSLCYRRPRHAPHWPYNLFCMIHGQAHSVVLEQIKRITQTVAQANPTLWQTTDDIEQDILFSTIAYKQHGARYSKTNSHKQVNIPAKQQEGVYG